MLWNNENGNIIFIRFRKLLIAGINQRCGGGVTGFFTCYVCTIHCTVYTMIAVRSILWTVHIENWTHNYTH